MNELFNYLDYVRIYIDDLLIIGNDSLKNYVDKLGKVLTKWKAVGFKANVEKKISLEIN